MNRERLRHVWTCWPGGPLGFDGASVTSVCAFCGARILQDSQGGWFAVQDHTNWSGA